MATTSFLYHTLGLAGYVHCRTDFVHGWVYHHIELAPHKRTCRNCGARWNELRLEGRFERTFFALPVGRRLQFIVLRGHRQRTSSDDAGSRGFAISPSTSSRSRRVTAT